MSTSANLALPFIEGGELLPDVTLNEALRVIDTLVQLAVVDRDLMAPPGSPSEGERWIVKATATGAWTGHATHIAAWQDGEWVFAIPRAGWLAYVIDEGTLLTWNGSAWVSALTVLASVLQNMTLLGIGTTADATNPFSAKLNNALWAAKTVAEGGDGDLRYKMSKESAANTLSLLFQDNFSGRAEIGLTGDDDFHFKVSADGSSWLDAITIDKSTGKLTLNQGVTNQAATRAQLYAAPFDALAFSGFQINGGMEISQENGTSSVTLTGSGSLQTRYVVDGVMAAYRGTFVAAGQQVTDAPPGYRNSLKLTVSTAQASLGTDDELSILMPVEGVRAARLALGNASAAAISFGFWVKAHRTGTYSGALRNSAKNRSHPFSFAVSASNTWEFKTVTVAGDTSGTWLTDTGVGLSLNICIAAGTSRAGTAGAWAGSDFSGATSTTNGVAATSDTFQITGLVVLPGIELPSAERAPYIMRPLDEELARCKRYWEKSYDYAVAPGTGSVPGPAVLTAIGNLAGSTGGNMGGPNSISFKAETRAAPTFVFYDFDGTANAVRVYPADAKRSGITVYANPLANGSIQFVTFNNASATAISAGNQLAFSWTANARL
jgi:hypothetical protein